MLQKPGSGPEAFKKSRTALQIHYAVHKYVLIASNRRKVQAIDIKIAFL